MVLIQAAREEHISLAHRRVITLAAWSLRKLGWSLKATLRWSGSEPSACPPSHPLPHTLTQEVGSQLATRPVMAASQRDPTTPIKGPLSFIPSFIHNWQSLLKMKILSARWDALQSMFSYAAMEKYMSIIMWKASVKGHINVHILWPYNSTSLNFS